MDGITIALAIIGIGTLLAFVLSLCALMSNINQLGKDDDQ